jgi:hypothetical protein
VAVDRLHVLVPSIISNLIPASFELFLALLVSAGT